MSGRYRTRNVGRVPTLDTPPRRWAESNDDSVVERSIRQRSAGCSSCACSSGSIPTCTGEFPVDDGARQPRRGRTRAAAMGPRSVPNARSGGARRSRTTRGLVPIASTGWAPTTIRQTRSVLDRYLHPHLGDLAVGEVTPTSRWSGGCAREVSPNARCSTTEQQRRPQE